MALVAQPAVGLARACKLLLKYPEQPARWQAPAVPDTAAGEWPEHVVATLATMVAGLTFHDEDERMPLTNALATLEAIVAAAPEPQPDFLQARALAAVACSR